MDQGARATGEPPIAEGMQRVHFTVECKAYVIEHWRADVPADLEGDELHDALLNELDSGATFCSQEVEDEHDRTITRIGDEDWRR